MYTRKIGKLLRAAVTVAILCGASLTAFAAPPNKESFHGDVVEEFVGDCGTFLVLNDYVIDGFFIDHFDKEGNLIQVNQHLVASESIYYRDDNSTIFLAGGPVEVSNSRIRITDDSADIAFSGLAFNVTVPGHGVVFHIVGHLVVDLITGEVVFQAGQNDFFDRDIAALCAALSPL